MLSQDVAYGQIIDTKLLTSVKLPVSLKLSAIPVTERGLAINQVATRDYRKGDLLLIRDFTADRRKLKLAADEEGLQLDVAGLHLSPVRVQVGDEIAFAVANSDKAQLPKRIGPFVVVGINELVETPSVSFSKLSGKTLLETLTLKVKLAGNQLPTDALELLRASQEGRIVAPLLKN
jgi:hypothetical protein